MRSYFVSFSFVAALLGGYTVFVLTNHVTPKSESPRTAAEGDHRQPATAVDSPAQADATNVD